MTTYKQAALTAFNVLAEQYYKDGIFTGNLWFGGNSLHTCLHFLSLTGYKDGGELLQYAYEKVYVELTKNNDGWWRDDYSWWGNAFTYAISRRERLGLADARYDNLFDELLSAAQSCWNMLALNWSERSYNYILDTSPPQTSDNAAGSAPITGGTFNTHGNPPMSGRNSVTNEGFWILSQELAKLCPQDSKYSEWASASGKWFAQWLALSGSLLNQQGLILERPMGNATLPGWYWSGDQGLFMTAIASADYNFALKIADSVVKNMTDANGILQENTEFYTKGALQQFFGDYATGKGIFMRNLAPFNTPRIVNAYDKFFRKNADAVWCHRLPGNQLTFNWNPQTGDEPADSRCGKDADLCNLIMQTSGLEPLTAAAASSFANEQMPCD